MKILVQLFKDFAGCGFYRLYQPNAYLAESGGAKVTFNSGFLKPNGLMTDNELLAFDMIIWHKDIGIERFEDVQRVKKLGIPVIIDFDDYWVLNDKHSMYGAYVKLGTSVKFHKLILVADYITCTTEILADQIYQHNKNVIVLPNAVDEKAISINRKPEDKYCFGYLGGHYHYRDVSQLEGLQRELTKECKNYELRLFGYDGTYPYQHYAQILSDNKRSPNFQIFKGLPIYQYYTFYNLMDCSLVPLENNNFNKYKSELKMIEAGFFRKPVIVSNVAPYTNVITKENCLSVNQKSDWFTHCKKLIDNPNLSKDLGDSLYQSVQRFSLEKVNRSRLEFYSNVYKKHNHNLTVGAGRLEAVN